MPFRVFMGWSPKNELDAHRGWTRQERAFYLASAIVRGERKQEERARREEARKRKEMQDALNKQKR